MASDETMTIQSSLQDEDFSDDIDDVYDHHHHHQQHPHPHNLSRLSVCTSSTLCGVDDEEDDDVYNAINMYVSGLSIESLEADEEGDADGEFSDGKEIPTGLSSDSENELGSCYSLPATPPRRRNRGGLRTQSPIPAKGYASDDETQKGVETKKNDPFRRRRSRRINGEGWGFNKWEIFEKDSNTKKKEEDNMIQGGFSGESDQSVGGGSGVMVITRPKGGRRSLCMDLEEVKACRDLGFELEHERMLEMPSSSRLSVDTSSDGNSPIANWRISSPGDDPRDVKARLRVWAQAVALASASKYST